MQCLQVQLAGKGVADDAGSKMELDAAIRSVNTAKGAMSGGMELVPLSKGVQLRRTWPKIRYPLGDHLLECR